MLLLLLGASTGCDRTATTTPGSGPKAVEPSRGSDEGVTQQLADPLADVDRPPPEDGEGSPAPSGVSRIGKFPPKPTESAEAVLLKLRRWVHHRGGHVFAVLVDLEQGAVLASHRPTEPVNPASNMKLLTAAAALDLLGPAFAFETELFADLSPSGTAAELVLRGGGDPGLSVADLSRLARSARQQGLTGVGDIICDQSRFTEEFVPPAFEQQPNEWASFRAPVSALSVERNAVTLHVMSDRAGSPARVWYEPPGVVSDTGSVRTGQVGSGDGVTWTLEPKENPLRPRSLVGGHLAEGLGRRRYSRRLEDPRLAGCLAFRQLLEELGVKTEGEVTLATKRPAPLPGRLTYVSSAPLADLLKPLGKESDNFTAETILINLSSTDEQDEAVPWSSQRGAARLLRWLKEGGVPADAVSITNGSGLFDANRLTASVLALSLARMEERPEIFAEFLAQLSIYGTDGTLRRRMREHPARSRIRAKTGTLRDVDALSGFILRKSGQRPLAFSLIVTDVPGGHAGTRTQLDQTVFAWLEQLAPETEPGAPPQPGTTQRGPSTEGENDVPPKPATKSDDDSAE